ncbi:MAG: hypothetical protein Q9181_004673 [Wetmoreana brouardii]
MLVTKRRRAFEQPDEFSDVTEPQATQEELDEAQNSRNQLAVEMEQQQRMTRVESDVQLLAAALRIFGKLAVLAVEAAVTPHLSSHIPSSSAREWHPIWIRAAQVYRVTMLAIARSSVAVGFLQIYRASWRCSVPAWDVNELIPALEDADFATAAKHIKRISLSVSTKVETDAQNVANARANLSGVDRAYYEASMGTQAVRLSEEDPDVVAEGNFPGIARLLKSMPNLESLDLHLYNRLNVSAVSYAKVFACVAEDLVLPSLRHCTLRGIWCSETSLLGFLVANNGIVTLEMRQIHFESGSWPSFFTHICSMPDLQELLLQNLCDATGLINLAPKDRLSIREEEVARRREDEDGGEYAYDSEEDAGKIDDEGYGSLPSRRLRDDPNCCYPCLGGYLVHTRSFTREEILKERFNLAKRPWGRQMGSPQFMRWMNARRAEFGPP